MSNSASRSAEVVGVSIAFFAIAALLTLMRFLTRMLIVRDFGPEDWTIGIATVFALALTICMNEQVHFGLGKHIETIPPEHVQKSLKPFWISIWVYYLALTFTKISILFQYYRIIVYSKTRFVIWIVMGIVIAFGIATVLDSIFLCFPVSDFWTTVQRDGACINENVVWYSNAAVNIALDVTIVVLPMRAIMTLTISKIRKIGVMCLFALGGFVTIISIVRLYTLHVIAGSHDPTWDNVYAAIWSTIECDVGIACACLPAIRPLISYLRGRRPTQSSHYRIPDESNALDMPLSPLSPSMPRHPSEYGTISYADRGHTPVDSPAKSGFLVSPSKSDPRRQSITTEL